MAYRPNPRISIGGTDFTGHAINQVSVSRGRRTVYERPNAGFAAAELIDVTGIPSFRVGDDFQVSIDRAFWLWEEAATAWSSLGLFWNTVVVEIFDSRPIFTGTLSDLTAEARPAKNGPVITYQLQAIGPLATLNRRFIYTGGRAAETDGARILNVLTTALGTAEVDPFVVDDGVFDLAAIGSADGGYNALRVAQDAAFSGQGVLFETDGGFIGFSNVNRRVENAQAGAVDMPFDVLSAQGVSVTQQLADITNAVTVVYDSGAVFEQDTDSVNEFGLFETEIVTQLVNQANAESRAQQFVSSHAFPTFVFDRLNLNLLSTPAELRNRVLELRSSEAVEVDAIPGRLGFEVFRGFVEGFTLQANPFEALLTLIVSDQRLSISGSVSFLYAFGTNRDGRTGLGLTSGSTSRPTQVVTTSDWTRCSAGFRHSLAIRDGRLFSFGFNDSGATGLGTTSGNTIVPTQVGTDVDWTDCSAGTLFSLAIRNGELYSFGSNFAARTGLGTTVGNQTTPARVGTATGWTRCSAGFAHSLGLNNGGLFSFGANGSGRTGLGIGSGNQPTPAQVGSDTDWTACSAGDNHSLAVRGGELYAFGSNEDGKTGLGVSSSSTLSPARVGSDDGWTTCAAGNSHSLAVSKGRLYAFGLNFDGRTGLGVTAGSTLTPQQVGTETTWTDCAAGFRHSLAIRSGRLHSFGPNIEGVTGLGLLVGSTLRPERVGQGTQWVDCSAGSESQHSLAIQVLPV